MRGGSICKYGALSKYRHGKVSYVATRRPYVRSGSLSGLPTSRIYIAVYATSFSFFSLPQGLSWDGTNSAFGRAICLMYGSKIMFASSVSKLSWLSLSFELARLSQRA